MVSLRYDILLEIPFIRQEKIDDVLGERIMDKPFPRILDSERINTSDARAWYSAGCKGRFIG